MKHPKTTIIGLIFGALISIQPLIENGDFDFKRDWVKLLIAASISVIGIIAKDPE